MRDVLYMYVCHLNSLYHDGNLWWPHNSQCLMLLKLICSYRLVSPGRGACYIAGRKRPYTSPGPSNGISNFYTTEAVHKANKLYVNLTKTLRSKSESAESDGNLPPGEHSFPFRFILPLRILFHHLMTALYRFQVSLCGVIKAVDGRGTL